MTTRVATMSAGDAVIENRVLLFPAMVGFFFVFRAGLTLLFFQSAPATGTAVKIGMGLALAYGAILHTAEDGARLPVSLARVRPLGWIFAMLGLSLASVMWTEASL